MFTEEQIEAYLKDPRHCPHCGSGDIYGDGMEWGLAEEMFCDQCGKSWYKVYELTNVVEKEG